MWSTLGEWKEWGACGEKALGSVQTQVIDLAVLKLSNKYWICLQMSSLKSGEKARFFYPLKYPTETFGGI